MQHVRIDRKHLVDLAEIERAERLVPAEMRVQQAGAVVAADPLLDQRVGLGNRPVLEHRVQQRVRAMRVVAAEREGALGHGPAASDLAILGHRPAETGEEPPVLAVMGGVTRA